MTSEADTHVDGLTAPLRTDVLIVGAGPVGLFAAFEAGVIGLSCQIVDTLERIDGQCIELYPDKPIYDIPAIPSCTARELVDRLECSKEAYGTCADDQYVGTQWRC
jgi:thioredoxin reductase (NADPH)